jgi:hypothetical protein
MKIPESSTGLKMWKYHLVIMTLITGFLTFNLHDLSCQILLGTLTATGILIIIVVVYEGIIFTKQIKTLKDKKDFADVEISSYDLQHPAATNIQRYEEFIFECFKKIKDANQRDFVSYLIVEYFSKDRWYLARYRADGVFNAIDNFRKINKLYPSEE